MSMKRSGLPSRSPDFRVGVAAHSAGWASLLSLSAMSRSGGCSVSWIATIARAASPAWRAGVLLLPLLAPAACESRSNTVYAYTETGQNLGPEAFVAIAPADSKVGFTGADPILGIEAQTLDDRYSERITFKNHAFMRYDKLFVGGFEGGWTDADSLATEVEQSPFYRELGIVFDPAKLKSGGYYTYLAQSSRTHNCFIFRGTFGDTSNGRDGNRGDQEIIGDVCYRTAAKSLDALEREMTNILARASYDR
jgi:hypothetical protein